MGSAASKKLREFEKEVRQWTADLATAKDSLMAFQNGPLVALEELSAEPVEEVAAIEAEASEESAGAVDETTSTPQAVEETVPQDVSMAPADVALPVASDKIVSTHAVNVAALSPQAGA